MDDAREKAKHKMRLRFGLGYSEPTDEQLNKILEEVRDLLSQGSDPAQIEPKLGDIARRHCPSYETQQYAPQNAHVLIEALIGLIEEKGI